MLKWRTRALWMLQHRRWPASTATAPLLDPTTPIEEERGPYYSPNVFYPARTGEVIHNRYQIATKLGCGSHSTVWLARDLQRWRWLSDRFVAIKIKANEHVASELSPENEISLHERISKTDPNHPGWSLVRQLIETFHIEGESGKHQCLVFEPLRETLFIYRRRWQDDVIPPAILKILLQQILHALDYLHSKCHIIHTDSTDLKPDNIMVKLEDASILPKDAQSEYEAPLPQKRCEDGRIIYLSRNNYGPLVKPTGIIRICDFDMAVRGDVPQKGCIQAEIWRAPEAILDAGYSYSADIWGLGVSLWDLLEGRSLFHALVPNSNSDEYVEVQHLAYITALIGSPPPRQLLDRGSRTSLFYDQDGKLKTTASVSEDFSFDSSIRNLEGKKKEVFIDFVKRMITWDPAERSTAKELLQHPWLYTDQ